MEVYSQKPQQELEQQHYYNPAASYPSPTTDRESPPPSSPVHVQQQQQAVTYPAGVSTAPRGSLADVMNRRVTEEELERLEDDDPLSEDKPRKAPPLPLEHIYVHDDNYPLRLTDFEVMETLGASPLSAVAVALAPVLIETTP